MVRWPLYVEKAKGKAEVESNENSRDDKCPNRQNSATTSYSDGSEYNSKEKQITIIFALHARTPFWLYSSTVTEKRKAAVPPRWIPRPCSFRASGIAQSCF